MSSSAAGRQRPALVRDLAAARDRVGALAQRGWGCVAAVATRHPVEQSNGEMIHVVSWNTGGCDWWTSATRTQTSCCFKRREGLRPLRRSRWCRRSTLSGGRQGAGGATGARRSQRRRDASSSDRTHSRRSRTQCPASCGDPGRHGERRERRPRRTVRRHLGLDVRTMGAGTHRQRDLRRCLSPSPAF
jgi:hypothetical protein